MIPSTGGKVARARAGKGAATYLTLLGGGTSRPATSGGPAVASEPTAVRARANAALPNRAFISFAGQRLLECVGRSHHLGLHVPVLHVAVHRIHLALDMLVLQPLH